MAQNATARDKLNKEDIPSLKSQIKEQEAKLHNVSQTAEEVGANTGVITLLDFLLTIYIRLERGLSPLGEHTLIWWP